MPSHAVFDHTGSCLPLSGKCKHSVQMGIFSGQDFHFAPDYRIAAKMMMVFIITIICLYLRYSQSYLEQTMFVGYIMLQLFYGCSLWYM